MRQTDTPTTAGVGTRALPICLSSFVVPSYTRISPICLYYREFGLTVSDSSFLGSPTSASSSQLSLSSYFRRYFLLSPLRQHHYPSWYPFQVSQLHSVPRPTSIVHQLAFGVSEIQVLLLLLRRSQRDGFHKNKRETTLLRHHFHIRAYPPPPRRLRWKSAALAISRRAFSRMRKEEGALPLIGLPSPRE